MPPQLKRLIPMFIIFIGLFLLVRHFLIPDSFGQYGHYRGDALEEIMAREVNYSTRSECVDCHSDIQEEIENDVHSSISCLSCHGPGGAHVEDPSSDNITRERGRQFCGRCHDINAARRTEVVMQVDLKTHNADFENCTDCHNPHKVWENIQ
jgi:predicted CXXCH cytochrome family protein